VRLQWDPDLDCTRQSGPLTPARRSTGRVGLWLWFCWFPGSVMGMLHDPSAVVLECPAAFSSRRVHLLCHDDVDQGLCWFVSGALKPTRMVKCSTYLQRMLGGKSEPATTTSPLSKSREQQQTLSSLCTPDVKFRLALARRQYDDTTSTPGTWYHPVPDEANTTRLVHLHLGRNMHTPFTA
jgi:hypothetical protein